MRGKLVLVVLLAWGRQVAGDPPAPAQKPLTPELAADAVQAARKAKDDAALSALASKDAPDPWLVADELLARGEPASADLFSKAAPRKDVERLPKYVASRRGKPDSATMRKSLATATAALAAGKPKDALDALGPSDPAAPVDVVGIRLAFTRGLALAAARRLEESATAYLVAADASERVGWLAKLAQSLHAAGDSAYRRSDFRGALSAWERLLEISEARGDRANVATALSELGLVHLKLGNISKALECQQRTLKMREDAGERASVARTLNNIGNIYGSSGSPTKALEYLERSLKIKEELGDHKGMAPTLSGIGNLHAMLGDHAKALAYHERALKLGEESGNEESVASTAYNMGKAHGELGNHAKALECYERALAIEERLGARADVAATLGRMGHAHYKLGSYSKSLEYYERALKLREELGDRPGVGIALGGIGLAHDGLGNRSKALDYTERALRVQEESGDRPGAAKTLTNLGRIHESHGSFPKAIDYLERALKMLEELGDRVGVVEMLGAFGGLHNTLGNYSKALEYHERALKMQEELGNAAGVARALGGIGAVHYMLGDVSRALELYERALKMHEESGNRRSVAITLGNMGLAHFRLGNLPKALEVLERSLKLKEDEGNRAGAATTLDNIGLVYYRLGNYAKALEHHERGLALAKELGDRWRISHGLSHAGRAHLMLGAPAEAARLLREATEQVQGLATGLADEQSALAREQFIAVFEDGVRAARGLDDATGASFFLESGRSGALLEGLGGRERLQGQGVPEELRRAEALARTREADALERYGRALDAGVLAEVRRLRPELDAARGNFQEVIERIQREAKKAADVVYPKAATLVEIQAALREGEALVVYGIFSEYAMALVVTLAEARIVDLGKATSIAAATQAAVLDAEPYVDEGRIGALRDLTVQPLALPADTKRVLVSMHGVLSYAPVSLLFPGHEVVAVPSGTTYRLLTADRARTGRGVLALGDPDVEAKRNPTAVAVYVDGVRSRGGPLTRLPAAQDEAKAVGDAILLGKGATEGGLRDAVAKRPRWGAVHFACHGLVDPEHPTLSSLALTPSGDDDGFLTALDVFRMNIPSDLVVLSGCETGKGKVYGAEGIVGLTRAFMFAGAPRVIVSLWKVDDVATKALMTRFYALWNPKDGSKPMSTAAALRAAQEHVRSQERWKHPNYWAAWVLWGLGD